MKWKPLLIVLVVIIVITNLPMITKNFIVLFDGKDHFRYANADASFTRIQGFGFKDGFFFPKQIEGFIEEEKPSHENSTLYRLYRINPFCFWRWSYYLSTSVDFEYKPWKEIEPNRVPYDPENRWQDF